jgi:hypothetical protein
VILEEISITYPLDIKNIKPYQVCSYADSPLWLEILFLLLPSYVPRGLSGAGWSEKVEYAFDINICAFLSGTDWQN